MLGDLEQLNSLKLEQHGDPEIATRIAQYEMAYRMQTSVPDLADLSDESQETLDMYGPDVTQPDSFAHHCLMGATLGRAGSPFRAAHARRLGSAPEPHDRTVFAMP
ncbi:MAG: DUF1501 domain-containing protein [Pirellulaceae bacterium]